MKDCSKSVYGIVECDNRERVKYKIDHYGSIKFIYSRSSHAVDLRTRVVSFFSRKSTGCGTLGKRGPPSSAMTNV